MASRHRRRFAALSNREERERMSSYRELYGSSRWQTRTYFQLKRKPVCEECERRGETWPATLSHHLEPHNGDPIKFFNGPLESLCRSCHERIHGRACRDFDIAIDASGWALDPRHPSN